MCRLSEGFVRHTGEGERTMKLRSKGTGKKQTLTGMISRIVLILFLVGILEAGAAYTMLEWYHAQVAELEYTISDIYLSEIDQNFNLINISVKSMLYGGEEIRQIQKVHQTLPACAKETEKLAYTLERHRSVRQLKEAFADMVLYYGGRISYFYFDPKNGLLVENGESEYLLRLLFGEMLMQKYEDGEICYTANGKWFLMGDYLCTIYKGPDGIIGGAYIWAGDFAANILQMSPTECSSIDIYDLTSRNSLSYERLENGVLSEGKRVMDTELPKDFYRLNHAQIVCRYAMDTSDYEKAVLLPVLFLWLPGISLAVMTIVVLYTRRRVLGQVNAFYNNLMEYRKTERFDEETGIREFAEAGKVLNKRSEEISRLKISIYEEQINRQKVELDYAQIQIRPHFYINCLNIIHSMAQEKLTHEIQELVVHISRYFRYIFRKGMEPVAVGKELEFTETYLRILECMNDTVCRYEVVCGEDEASALIPPLIIQTFVENSVKHNMEESADCAVFVRVERFSGELPKETFREPSQEGEGALLKETAGCACGDQLRISVWDNGSGFDSGVLERLRKGDFGAEHTGFHIGISNAIARIRMIYGEEAYVEFSNSKEGGARVDIFVPFISQGEEREQ